MERRVAVVKIAAPLYDVQGYFYERANTDLPEGQQDGALLNFLGSHFRRTAPDFLLDDFADRCAGAILGGADAVICDDARPTDAAGLTKQGFTVVQVSAPDPLRRLRKSKRGDRTVGNDEHPTEAGLESISVDFTLENSGSLSGLEAQVTEIAKTLITGPGPADGVIGGDQRDGNYAVESLIRHAGAMISRRYAENRHQIGAVILAGDGRVFTGLHVEAMVGRASVCAEAVALGKAREAGVTDLRIVLAVRHPKPSEAQREPRLVPPCGLCRELLLDYGPDIHAVISMQGELNLVPLSQMLPHKYVGTKWKATDPDHIGK
ncbi:cytidine deaminase [Spinactinospora alkalitolerans]|uniref:Cytidine deaminase n=2 Tax=Spinactinospora alkalitolerans TaxID=687207 RepID=A0A852U4J1_9ACTN|nr:cytidine deaminase [Spinactinospora alkalitolerans]NYE50435.1 cytidine deaminase [Spinactinospora alkalitolerans]